MRQTNLLKLRFGVNKLYTQSPFLIIIPCLIQALMARFTSQSIDLARIRQYRGPWEPLGSPRDTLDPLRSSGNPWDVFRSPGIPWDPLGSLGSPGILGIPWDPLGSPGISWDLLGSPEIQDSLGSLGIPEVPWDPFRNESL